MSELVAEVCRAHIDSYCRACDEFDDELWIHPNDLNTCGHCGMKYAREWSFYDDDDPPLCPGCGDLKADAAECRLCRLLVETRQENIAVLQDRIAMNEAEIAEIDRGERHTAYHKAHNL